MTSLAKLKICRGLRCMSNAPDGATVLKLGASISAGPFRCAVLSKGVRCLVPSLGHGFLIGPGVLKRL